MIKKTIALALFLSVTLLTALPAAAWTSPESYEVGARGCIVMEMQSKRVLFEYNSTQKLPMASTTKIMSAWLAVEQPNLDELFAVDNNAIRVEGSSMGLVEGDIVSMRALCYGMLLPSGNDAANAAGVKIAGSTEKFVEMMNTRAQEIGMANTHFVTASGLDATEHYSTAYDMALLAANALANPDFVQMCSTSKAQVQFGNPPFDRWLTNNNKMLTHYEGAIGVKTGFTDNARRCLVSAATRDGVTLICVTLNSGDDWNIHTGMFDKYFAQLKMEDMAQKLPPLSVAVTGGTVGEVAVAPFEPMLLPLKNGEAQQIITEISLRPFEYAPITKGQVLGDVRCILGGKEIFSTPLVAQNNVISVTPPKTTNSLFDKLKNYVINLF